MQPQHSTELKTRRGELRTRRGKLRNQRGIFFSRRVSICHMYTRITEITGSLLKRQFQISKRHLLFQMCQCLSHAYSALRKSWAVCRSVDSKYRKGTCFSRCVSVCHMQLNLAKIMGNLSKISCEVEGT
ncbi:hypothetical protein ACFX10_000181 [Malus domestica]